MRKAGVPIRRVVLVVTAALLLGAVLTADSVSAGEPRIVMRVKLSVRSPVRFSLHQDAAAYAISSVVVARENTLDKTFSAILNSPGEDAYQVESGEFERLSDALDMKRALEKYLSYEDRVRYSPYIAPTDRGWALRVGKSADPAAAYKIRSALAWVAMDYGLMPATVQVRTVVTKRVDLPAGGGPYEVRGGDLPGEVVLEGPSGLRVSFPCGVRVVPGNPLETAFSLGGSRYRGELEVTKKESWSTSSAELVTVNRVDLETYVEGVLAGEVFPGWEMEALKAQAVAARTYALYRRGDSLDRGYDVDDTVSYQRYAGEHRVEAFRKAVRETRGEVLIYRGALIKAYYFASGGGMTEGDEEVWPGGGDEPYLSGTKDFDQISPHYFWQNPLALWGVDLLGRLGMQAVFPAWIEPAMKSGEKILAYRFRTATDSRVLTREQIRWKLGLKSPRFKIRLAGTDETGIKAPASSLPQPPALPSITACAARRNGGEITGYQVTLDAELLVKGKEVAGPEEISPATLVIIDGAGYGHGVGLSQWGAQGMALMRNDSGTPLYSYIDILKHYYSGVEVADNYNLPSAPVGPESIPIEISNRGIWLGGPEEACKLEPRETFRCD
ncbi:MAG: SpoIID/LytB domain-containing protein [Bacillota bacterium]